MDLEKLIAPLRDRKVQAALAVIVVAYAAQFGLELDEGTVAAVMAAVLTALIAVPAAKKK